MNNNHKMADVEIPIFLRAENLANILHLAEARIKEATHVSIKVEPSENVVAILEHLAADPAYSGYVYGNNPKTDLPALNEVASERISKLFIAPEEAGQYWLGNRFDGITRTGKRAPVAGMIAAANDTASRRRHISNLEMVKVRQALYSGVSDKFSLGEARPTDDWKMRDF